MPAKLAIIAALPREIAGLVRGVRADAQRLQEGIHLYRLPKAVVVAGGMGAARAALAFEAAAGGGEITEVISAGLAGGCAPELQAGEVVQAAVVIEARTGEHFATTSRAGTQAVLVTGANIAGVQEKARLHAAYRAAMVDMEAATVARLAAAHHIPFRAIKGISDAHDFEMASLSSFTGERGEFRTAAFALHTVLRPKTWGKAMQLGRDSGRALAALHQRLSEIIRNAG